MFRPRKRHSLWHVIGWITLGAGVLGALLYYRDKKRREQEELDWFLLGDSYRPQPNPLSPADQESALLKDLAAWRILNQEDQDVTLSFSVEDAELAKKLMSQLAANGISSLLDEGNGIVDVLIAGSVDNKELDELIRFVAENAKAHQAQYQGYVFDY